MKAVFRLRIISTDKLTQCTYDFQRHCIYDKNKTSLHAVIQTNVLFFLGFSTIHQQLKKISNAGEDMLYKKVMFFKKIDIFIRVVFF